MECPSCYGTGEISCYVCGGNGQMFVVPGWEECDNCSGRGYVKCDNCGGSGSVYGYDDNQYDEWLNDIGEEDTSEIRGWFYCEENERAQYLEDHPDLFDHDDYY